MRCHSVACGMPDAAGNAIGYAKFRSPSHGTQGYECSDG